MKTDREIRKMENIIAAESYLEKVRMERANKFLNKKELISRIKSIKINHKNASAKLSIANCQL